VLEGGADSGSSFAPDLSLVLAEQSGGAPFVRVKMPLPATAYEAGGGASISLRLVVTDSPPATAVGYWRLPASRIGHGSPGPWRELTWGARRPAGPLRHALAADDARRGARVGACLPWGGWRPALVAEQWEEETAGPGASKKEFTFSDVS
jgi:hypothetical protein